MENNKPTIFDENQTINFLLQIIGENYWFPLYNYLKENPLLINSFTGFLLNHDKIILYIGKTHLAIEYFGPERIIEINTEVEMEVITFDFSQTEGNFFEQIIGFKYERSTADFKMPLIPFSYDWVLPTNAGLDKLIELKWNFSAQNSIMGINTNGFEIPDNQFCRIVNGLFFDADEMGLKTRHVKWIDFIPLTFDDSNTEYDTFGIEIGYLKQLVEHDANYVYPLPPIDDYKFSKLPQINRFIELIGNKQNSEPLITKFLEQAENLFILSMGFLAKEIHPQIECEWQSENKDNIKPDFFIVKHNGYADIVEFKLPHIKSESIVGRTNRETFSAEINSYISQTRNYKEYFEDPNNRNWMEKKYGIKVHYPRRILIIGRRWDFRNDEWKSIINDYKDIEIMTYEDLIDGVVAQFYL